MLKGMAIVKRRQRSGVRQRERYETCRQIPHSHREHAGRQRPARGKHAETEDDLPEARQEHQRAFRVAMDDDGEQHPGDARRNVLLDRSVEHFIGKAAMLASRARDHFGPGHDQGENRHPTPQREIGERRCDRVGEVEHLSQCGDEREHSARRDRDRPVAAKLRAARQLAADRRDVRQCPLEVPHGALCLTLQCKVHWDVDQVKALPASTRHSQPAMSGTAGIG